jgi:hypothetical protein
MREAEESWAYLIGRMFSYVFSIILGSAILAIFAVALIIALQVLYVLLVDPFMQWLMDL